MPKKRVVVDSDCDDDDNNEPPAKRPLVAPSEEEEEDLFGDKESQASPKRTSAVHLELDEDDYALIEQNTGVAMEREATRQRLGEMQPQASTAALAVAPVIAPVPSWPRPPDWLMDDVHGHLAPKGIPQPPAHLVEGTGARPRIPAKPKLPTQRKLTRPAGCLRPYTHPFAKDEVAAIRRSDRCQRIMDTVRTHADIVGAMGQLAREAKKLIALEQSPMTYWFNNIQAEVESRGLGKPNGSTALIAAWDKSVHGDIFAGLMRLEPEDNPTVCPVEYDLYLAARKPQEEERAKAQQKIDAWEAEHGEAQRAFEERCGEWRKYAAEKGAAVAYREYAAKNEHRDGERERYRFVRAQVILDRQSSHEHFSTIMKPYGSALLDKMRRLRDDGHIVAIEARRYYANRRKGFQAKLMLRNAISADKEYRDRIAKEMATAKELVALTERWVNEVREQQNQWIKAERASLKRALDEINATGEREMRETLGTAHAYGYVCTDKTLEKWPGAAWTKPYEEQILRKALAVEDALQNRIDKVGCFLSDHRRLCKELETQERDYAKFFKPLPGLDDADPSSSDDDDDDEAEFSDDDAADEEEGEDVTFTKEVTREERDARGWAEAAVLD